MHVTNDYLTPGGEGNINKRLPVVLDEECIEILKPLHSRMRPEYVRQAIKHYFSCQNLSSQIERLEQIIGSLESGQALQAHLNIAKNETTEKEVHAMDYILDGVLSAMDFD